MTAPALEDVVLLDDAGRRVGTTAKAAVHHRSTPLHLAFSIYVVRADGSVLLTRRSATKRTWPGVLTNSCCGHPLPDEGLEVAVRRRLAAELGLTASEVNLVLPRFRYQARMPDGTCENEMCPVFRVRADGPVRPDPAEVGWTGWLPWSELSAGVTDGTLAVSPWCRAQVSRLGKLGSDARVWPAADPALLPPAAALDRVAPEERT
jgi:isopentenyl-diphosphate Delta-isomerase